MKTEFNKVDLKQLNIILTAVNKLDLDWDDTKEGEDYWYEVLERLERIHINYQSRLNITISDNL